MRICFVIFLFLLLSGVSATAVFALADESSAQSSVEEDFNADFDDDFGSVFEDEDPDTPLISDPFEGYNRGVFWFNDKLYFYLFKPVVRGYRVVPRPVRSSIGNFFSNLSSPISIANAILQFKFIDATLGASRLFINTTIGLGGLFDPAEHWGKIPAKNEDFGQTLGHYGVGQGPYFVLPIFGPSSIRDTSGHFADIFFDPLAYAGESFSFWEYVGIKSLDFLNTLSLDDDNYEKIKRDSLDPYLFMRAAYAQYRLAKVKE